MVLHPLVPGAERQSEFISAWRAVETTQKQTDGPWLLITQPDHAQLAGDLAARLQSSLFPQLDQDVVRAIALHDAGWTEFDLGRGMQESSGRRFIPKLTDRGKPVSFLEVSPAEFVVAWTKSIEAAERTGAVGGIIVSRHFCRLADARLNSQIDDEENTSRLRYFLQHEARRQQNLNAAIDCPAADLDALTNVLQFCDLLSLYLCCGAAGRVEFPQQFNGATIEVEHRDDMFRFNPAIFGSGASLGVSALIYPTEGHAPSRRLAFLLR